MKLAECLCVPESLSIVIGRQLCTMGVLRMGLYHRDASGVSVGGPLLLDPRILPKRQVAEYLVVDDTRYDEHPGERLTQLQALAPDLQRVAQFSNPESGLSVTEHGYGQAAHNLSDYYRSATRAAYCAKVVN